MSQTMGAEEHYKLGVDYAQQNRDEEAIREFEAALLIDPNYAEAHKALGRVYLSQQRVEEFIREFEAALRLNANDLDTHHGLGSAYISQKRAKEAIREFEAILRIDPNHKEAHFGLGSAYVLQLQAKEAIREFEAVLRIDPNEAAAHYGLGTAYEVQTRGIPDDKAVREYETAIRLDPNIAAAHFQLARGRMRQRREEEGYREGELAEKLGFEGATQWLDKGTDRIIDELLSLFRKYAAHSSPNALDAFRKHVQRYLFAIDARLIDRLNKRIAQGQSSDELSRMRVLLSQFAEEGMKMGDQAKPEVSFQSEKKKADSQWDTYSALERFSLALGDFIVACWLLSIIWHTSLWPIGLFLLAYIPESIAGMNIQNATRLVNTETFERTYASIARIARETVMPYVYLHKFEGDREGQTPATMGEALGSMERDGPNLGQLLGRNRATAYRNVWVGIAWEVIAIGLTTMGIMLSSPELLSAASFVVVVLILSLVFAIARTKLGMGSSVRGLIQLINLTVGGFVLYVILDRMNQPLQL